MMKKLFLETVKISNEKNRDKSVFLEAFRAVSWIDRSKCNQRCRQFDPIPTIVLTRSKIKKKLDHPDWRAPVYISLRKSQAIISVVECIGYICMS